MTDHSALIERLEAMGRSHRAHESGLRKRLSAGDRSLSVQDPDNAARSAETCEKAAAALRDQQSKMQMMQARIDRWEPKPFCGPSFSSSFLTGQAEQPSDASRIFRPSAGSARPLPSAPNQAKALK